MISAISDYRRRLSSALKNDVVRIWRAGAVHIGFSQWVNHAIYIAQRVLLSRILGTEGIGHIAVVSTTLQLIRLPAGGGVFTALTKLMAESNRDIERERVVMGTALYINLATAVLTSAFAWLVLLHTHWVPDRVANRILRLMVPFLPVVILSESFRCALMGQRRMRAAGLAITISAFLSMAIVILWAWFAGLSGWSLAQIATFFIVLACVAYPMRAVISVRWDGRVARRLLHIGVFAFLAQLAGQLVLHFDTLAVSGLLKDTEATAIYNTASLVAQQLIIVPGAILAVAFPMVAQNRHNMSKLRSLYVEISKKLAWLTVVVSVAAPLLVYPLFRLMGDKFILSLPPFLVLLLGFVARSLYILDNTYLDALGRTDLTFVSGLIAMGTTIVLNLLMIPRGGVMGAAWATTLAMYISLLLRRAMVYLFIFRWQALR